MSADTTKDRVMQSFLARGVIVMDSMFKLCEMSRIIDANILLRTLVDLVVHMKYVGESNLYDEYDYYTLEI